MSSGLNALSSNRNNTNNNTLGSDNTNDPVFGQPDEIIVLSSFKLSVQNAIDKAKEEIKFIDNSDANNPGILQTFAKIWPKTEELDVCVPGPDLNWQERVGQEVVNHSTANDADNKALQESADSFKAWLPGRMESELPSGANYIFAVNSIKTIQDQAVELAGRKNKIMETLITLESIKADLGSMTTQPATGSSGEANMVRAKQRFDAMLLDLSSTASVNDTQNKLDDAKDKLDNLGTLIPKCATERTTKGWENPRGALSRFNNSGTEKEIFCESHIDPRLSCDVIFKASEIDYKKNLPN
jgi:hypothetical protein